jgi:hypothetical protein
MANLLRAGSIERAGASVNKRPGTRRAGVRYGRGSEAEESERRAAARRQPKAALGLAIDRKGTCQIWKIRKFYNTCREALTQVKEFERPCTTGTFAPQAGPSRSRTAVVATDTGELVTLGVGANLGGRPIAGSIPSFSLLLFTRFTLLGELIYGGVPLLVTEPKDGHRYLEVSLGFLPGGVTLKPAGTAGSEKIVDFHVQVQ